MDLNAVVGRDGFRHHPGKVAQKLGRMLLRLLRRHVSRGRRESRVGYQQDDGRDRCGSERELHPQARHFEKMVKEPGRVGGSRESLPEASCKLSPPDAKYMETGAKTLQAKHEK